MADVDVTHAMGRTAMRGAMRETASGVDLEAAPDVARENAPGAARAGEPEVERWVVGHPAEKVSELIPILESRSLCR